MKASAHSLRDDVYYYFIKVPHPGYFSDFTEFENETKGSTMDYDCQLGSQNQRGTLGQDRKDAP